MKKILTCSLKPYGTVYENLAYEREGISREEVIQAAKAARIHNFITELMERKGFYYPMYQARFQ